MTPNTENQDKTFATLIHLSVLSMFFFPFGNLIFPVVFWSIKKENPFVDHHGRSALNFQISLFLYTTILISLAVAGMVVLGAGMNWEQSIVIAENSFQLEKFQEVFPFLTIIMVLVVLLLALFVLQIVTAINASLKAGNGELYTYPLSINFLGKGNHQFNNQFNHQSKNEQFNNTQNKTV